MKEETRTINPEDYVRDLNYNPSKGMIEKVTINLDMYPVEIIKNGKRYSWNEFIEECINNVLNLRMQEGNHDTV